MIGFKAQLMIGGNGVVAGVLELIRHQLVHQTDPAAFLQLINKDAATGSAMAF